MAFTCYQPTNKMKTWSFRDFTNILIPILAWLKIQIVIRRHNFRCFSRPWDLVDYRQVYQSMRCSRCRPCPQYTVIFECVNVCCHWVTVLCLCFRHLMSCSGVSRISQTGRARGVHSLHPLPPTHKSINVIVLDRTVFWKNVNVLSGC